MLSGRNSQQQQQQQRSCFVPSMCGRMLCRRNLTPSARREVSGDVVDSSANIVKITQRKTPANSACLHLRTRCNNNNDDDNKLS